LKKEATVEEINKAFKDAASNILGVTEEPLVSMDIKEDPHSTVVDLALTIAQGNLAKVVGWYDNEWGYSNRLVEMAKYISNV
jgi:glyceraldehyde 3-phosphate dehydrogenase